MTLILSGTDGLSDIDGSAATPAIRGTDANTGIFFPAADTIAFAEGGVESMRLDSSGNLQFNSGYGSVATAYGCRAWVNFNGTTNVGGFCTIRASGNVTSVTDGGVGIYTINFTTALPDRNYSVVGLSWSPGATAAITAIDSTPSVSSVVIAVFNTTGTARIDVTEVNVSIFR